MDQTQQDREAMTIVARFEQWVKQLQQQVADLRDEPALRAIEQQVRSEGQALLGRLFETLLQQALACHEPATRACPHCRIRRRHKGRRPRRLLSSLGGLKVESVYWQCPACGMGEHALDRWASQSLSPLLVQLLSFTAASTTSFARAEQATARLVGVPVPEQTLRRVALQEGQRLMREPATPASADASLSQPASNDLAVGSCDGTMVHTRQSGWREIKACRFERGEQAAAAATLGRVEAFEDLLTQTAEQVNWSEASQQVFVSDAAVWIKKLVGRRLPEAQHIADLWHVCQHLHETGKRLYGEGHPRARRWGRYWGKRLRSLGGAAVADRLRHIALFYRKLEHQRAVLKLARFLSRHADRLAYPQYEAHDWPISSGPMESYCKQLGLRLKGRGMRWSEHNVTPMATLVTWWSPPTPGKARAA